ncbi:MAG: type II toxin-antitoxin system RelE/ParE family toxin [Proteobacteria bacterium]|nr:type II toxin-antitoxin system RelE/ParE family toxin [Pseudomonadota bacterium]
MEELFAPAFRRFVKKQSLPLQLAIQDEVDRIIADPDIGEGKKGDLAGFRVHKFKFHRQEYLISYETGDENLLFVMIGTHENFYRDLKKYQKEFQP